LDTLNYMIIGTGYIDQHLKKLQFQTSFNSLREKLG
jgi:hypothetical protein